MSRNLNIIDMLRFLRFQSYLIEAHVWLVLKLYNECIYTCCVS